MGGQQIHFDGTVQNLPPVWRTGSGIQNINIRESDSDSVGMLKRTSHVALSQSQPNITRAETRRDECTVLQFI